MKLCFFLHTLILTCLNTAFTIPSPAWGADRAASENLKRTKDVLRSHIGEVLDDTGIPSMSIALIKGDRIIWTEAFGHANVKRKVPATAETIYSTGSCLKPITVMAAMQLVDRAKLRLDDPIKIRDVFPTSPASRAGLARDFTITRVNGVPVAGKSVNDLRRMLGGRSGKKVKLKLIDTHHRPRTVMLSPGKYLAPG